ncbi:MAG: type I pullulanase [Bacilli bacterium]|nr:type I pullulanase [Bacilli bacterium]
MIKEINLVSWDSFEVLLSEPSNIHVDFFVDGNLKAIRIIENDGCRMLFHIEEEVEVLGHECIVKTFEFGEKHLNVNKAIDFYDFDHRYYYDGNDLGLTYSPQHSEFKLWAPLAYHVGLLIKGNEYEMLRIENGVFALSLDGNFEGEKYRFAIYQNGERIETIDPYAKASSSNGQYSFVIDRAKIEMDMYEENLPEMNSYLDAIIYELNVRDMTIDEHANIEHKGKFLGLIEKGRTTKGGNPAGFDYITSLGITHIQLMPVLDFVTVDESNPGKKYNWGYDPQQYFTLEGSYATNPDDPYSRIKEFKRLVREFHRYGIRVNLDVVYNHVYEAKLSNFQKIVPNYFFRRDEDGNFMNHSFCGNEVASERAMVRKLIVDSIKYLMEEYHVDGFRFDLMGLMDVATMQEIERVARNIKKDVMLYGEGWDMCAETSDDTPLANMNNSEMLPTYAFFNDRYRNIVRGPGHGAKLEETGYILGNIDYLSGFKFAYFGGVNDVTYPPIFDTLSQSLNYVECHDNATLYDVIKRSTDIEDATRLIKKVNKVLLFSFGIPFFHAGQEIGLSKYNHSNTYNEGDKFNKFRYDVLDERIALSNSFKAFVRARKAIKLFSVDDIELVKDRVELIEEDDILHIVIRDIKENEPTYHIFVNPTSVGQRIHLDSPVDFYAPFGYRKSTEKHILYDVDVTPNQACIFIEVEDNR